MTCRPGDHTFVRLRTFLRMADAEIAKSALGERGIEGVVLARSTRGGDRTSAVVLLVRADDVVPAEAVLASR